MELEKLKRIIAEVMNIEVESITEDTSFVDDLGADSLDLFELVTNLEEEYNIEIPAEELITRMATTGCTAYNAIS